MYPHRDAPERKFSLKFLSSTVVHFLIQESGKYAISNIFNNVFFIR